MEFWKITESFGNALKFDLVSHKLAEFALN